tara:strand:- start:146 stop:820 length:675 start_codon:yes stop_codon:yes gene_type:complete
MDRITRLLIRFASLVVILSGIGGLSIYAFKSGIFKNPEFLSFNNLSNKIKSPNKIIKKGSCPKTHNYSIDKFCMNEKGYEMYRKEKRVAQKKCAARAKAGIQPYAICYDSFFPSKYKPTLDKFVYKNKTYVATQVCLKGQNMYWSISGVLRKKISEMGCMTPSQFESAKTQPRRFGGGGGGSYRNTYVEGWNSQKNLYRSIDNFHNTGSFDQPTFNFNTNTGGF